MNLIMQQCVKLGVLKMRFTHLYVHSFINQRDNNSFQTESVQCLEGNKKKTPLILACDSKEVIHMQHAFQPRLLQSALTVLR